MSDRLEKVAAQIASVNKKFKKTYGAEVLVVGSTITNFKPLATGFPTVDWGNSGIGGLPRGGITLVHGLESTGKSTFLLEIIAYQQSIDPNFVGLYIDVENAMTESFLRFKGIDPARLIVCRLNNEDALIAAEEAIKSDLYDIIVVDSLAKLESTTIMKKDLGESAQRNRRAVMITEFLRRISFILRNSNTAFVMINQEIQNQDPSPWAPKYILPCGMQQKYSSNLIIELKRRKSVKQGDKKIGYELDLTSKKCKISDHENVKTKLVYLYQFGFLRHYSVLDYLTMTKYVRKLTMGRYEFTDKKLYPETFKPKELIQIATMLLDVHKIDIYNITPDGVEFEKAEPSGPPDEGSVDVEE